MVRPLKTSRFILLAAIALGSTMFLSNPAGATFPGPNGKIAFVRGGNIWVTSPNGSGQVRLTATGTAASPQWSADGKKISYDQGSAGAGRNIWVMNGNGSGKYQVTSHVKNEFDPAWSPDGRWLAFVSDRRGRREIFRLRSTAPFGNAIRLTSTAGTGEPEPSYEDPYLSDSQPNWSPSGNRIAFSRYIRSDNTSFFSYGRELMTMNPDGSGMAHGGGLSALAETCPSWSPGGLRISWVDDEWEFLQGQSASNVWHTNPSGSSQVQVTHFDPNTPWHLGCASWSPYRGTSIVFSGFVDRFDPASRPAIYRVPANGSSAPSRIVLNGADPDWGRVPA